MIDVEKVRLGYRKVFCDVSLEVEGWGGKKINFKVRWERIFFENTDGLLMFVVIGYGR